METQESIYPMEYNQCFKIVQANELIRAKQDCLNLKLLEAKLIRLVISQIAQHDTELKTYTCQVVDLAKFLGIPQDDIYRDIEKVTDSLMRRVITIRKYKIDKAGKIPWKKLHWVETAEYDDGIITIKLSDELKPYVLGLNELFTSYDYGFIIGLPTVYSIRLFELLYSFDRIRFKSGQYPMNTHTSTGVRLGEQEISFTLQYLREYFNCVDKYPNGNDFIRRVIEPAVKAIRKKSTMFNVSYRTVKQGKRIADVIFTLG